MDIKTRADLVRESRLEMKQRRLRPARELTSDEQAEQSASRWLRTADRRRPRLTRNSTDADRATLRERTAAYEQDRTSRGGFRVGERLRENRESGNLPRAGAVRSELVRRSNVRLIGRTMQTGMGPGNRGIVRTLTPSQRINEVGTASRRRRVSPGMVPDGPPPRRRNMFGF